MDLKIVLSDGGGPWTQCDGDHTHRNYIVTAGDMGFVMFDVHAVRLKCTAQNNMRSIYYLSLPVFY